MTAHTTISNALVAVGAKPFATTIQALRDNPIATAEGALGAPKVVSDALSTNLGDFALSTTYAGISGLSARLKKISCSLTAQASATAVVTVMAIQARVSTDNGATWGADVNLAVISVSASVGGALWGSVIFDRETGAYRAMIGGAATSGSVAGLGASGTMTAAFNAIQFRVTPTSGGFVSASGHAAIVGTSGVSP